jgi:hypothetical protein
VIVTNFLVLLRVLVAGGSVRSMSLLRVFVDGGMVTIKIGREKSV